MRIVEVTPRFPPAIGGLENHVYNISLEFVKRGHKVVVITSTDAEVTDVVDKEIIDGIEVYRFPLFLPKPFREVWLMPTMVKVLESLQIDIIHAHGYRCLSSCIASRLAKLKKIPFVLTPHGIFPKRNWLNGLVKSIFDYSLGSMLLRSSDKIIALTESNRSLILSMGTYERKTVIVENGVDVRRYHEIADVKKLKKVHGFLGPVLLYVGRIAWHKNLEQVIQALPSIKKDFDDVNFLLVGPSYENGLTNLVSLAKKLGVEGSVVAKGTVSESQLHLYYSIADVFILPSIYEGLSLSMLEAMACKVPIIARSSAGINSILTHKVNALVLENGTPEEISSSVGLLLSYPELREKTRQNAYNLILHKYTWKTIVDKLESIYEELISANLKFK
ncbi:MAG: glycosyltransferase family 4 protein [Candidatus Bathyarchaeota archaeon]|nr:glycosyltransferase family 4 protein [Candidatus Bathyarchaeota archaeon]